MPFRSEAQRRLCWTKYNRDIRDGRKPEWDCHAWEEETHDKPLPYYNRKGCKCNEGSFKKNRNPILTPIKKMSRKKRKSMHRSLSRSRKIRTGPRGGKYVLVKGKKIYV